MSARNLMVLVDGSEFSEKAFQKALSCMRENDTLTVVTAIEFLKPLVVSHSFVSFDDANKELQEQGKVLLAKYIKEAKEAKAKDGSVKSAMVLASGTSDNIKEATLKFAEKHKVDTIFVGTRGLGAVKRFFVGSFSNYIIQHSHCDVMHLSSVGQIILTISNLKVTGVSCSPVGNKTLKELELKIYWPPTKVVSNRAKAIQLGQSRSQITLLC
eukprot:g11573.t1